jgi:CDP-diacylglycerol--serine O-phosphatidyltransferase
MADRTDKKNEIKVKRTIQRIKRQGSLTLPSLFTIGNMACGFFSILASVNGNCYKAGWLILIAMLLDGFDGRLARLLPADSSFGVEMDSLADLMSFCAAPAFLMYFFALQYIDVFGAPVAFIYALFGALRLAKFNAMSFEGKTSKKYFSGLPTPAAAAVLASFAVSYSILMWNRAGSNIKPLEMFMPYIYNTIAFIMIALALLMVSDIPYAAFKGKRETKKEYKKNALLLIILAAILVFLLIRHPQDVVFIVFSVYVLMGIVTVLFRAFRSIGDKNDK